MVREKPRRVGAASREETKMKVDKMIVAMYQGRGLYSREKLEGCLRGRHRVENEREMVL